MAWENPGVQDQGVHQEWFSYPRLGYHVLQRNAYVSTDFNSGFTG